MKSSQQRIEEAGLAALKLRQQLAITYVESEHIIREMRALRAALPLPRSEKRSNQLNNDESTACRLGSDRSED